MHCVHSGSICPDTSFLHFFQEMIEIVRESLIHMLHTRDGAHAAMKCIWNGTAKVGL